MTRNVLTVAPETPLKAVAALIAAEHISGVPVVAAGAVLGVVSETDVVRVEQGGTRRRGGVLAWLLNGADTRDVRIEARTAAEAMTAPAITVPPGRSVAEAARLMIERDVTRLPVVLDGALVGIVTRGDLVRAFARSDEQIEAEIYDDVLARTFWVAPEHVAVHVENGVVALEGVTQTHTEAELIEAFVRRVPGVSLVRSSLRWRIDDLHEPGSDRPGEPLH